MSINRIALIVGVLLILIIGVWGFINLKPLISDLLGGPTGSVVINGKEMTVTLADTPERREKGLSGKKSLAKDRGMLFIFTAAEYPSFWMKEMLFPIDIIFINNEKVVTIYENVPAPESPKSPLPLYKPTEPANMVLEVNAGQAKELGLQNGSTIQVNTEKK